MQAMVFTTAGKPLQPVALPIPQPGAAQLLIEVHACGLCRTDLHVVDGELTEPKKSVIPGHEIVGTIAEIGPQVEGFRLGERVGVPWLGYTCGVCRYCRSGYENLCDQARFTGYTLDGGYAEYVVADSRYCFSLPDSYSDLAAAPLLCAGLIGYRALRMAGDAARVGIYGFGAAAHVITQVMRRQGREVFACTRPGDHAAQQFALSLGVSWAGDSTQPPPERLEAALLFAPVGDLVPLALRHLVKGGLCDLCRNSHEHDSGFSL